MTAAQRKRLKLRHARLNRQIDANDKEVARLEQRQARIQRDAARLSKQLDDRCDRLEGRSDRLMDQIVSIEHKLAKEVV